MNRQDLIDRLRLVRDKINLDIGKISLNEPLVEDSAILTDLIEDVIAGPVEE